MDRQRAALQWVATILGGLFPLAALIADIFIPHWRIEWIHLTLYAVGVLSFVGMAFGIKLPAVIGRVFNRPDSEP